MPVITTTQQNSTPLFKEDLQVRQQKQESSKGFTTKTKIAAAGILSTLGLVCLPQYFTKEIPNNLIPATNPVGTLLKIMGVVVLLSPLGYLFKNKNTQKSTEKLISDFDKILNFSNKKLNIPQIHGRLHSINEEIMDKNLNPSSFTEELDSLTEKLLEFDDSSTLVPEATLTIWCTLICKINPAAASSYCKILLSKNKHPELNNTFSDIINKMEGKTTFEMSKKFEGQKTKDYNKSIIIKTNKDPNFIFEEIVLPFNQVLQKSLYKTQNTIESFAEIFKLTKKINSLGNLNRLFENPDRNFAYLFKTFISDLSKIVQTILYDLPLLYKFCNDDTFIKIIKNSFNALLNISKNAALRIAADYLIIKPEKDDKQTLLYHETILNCLMKNKDLAIEFAMICAVDTDAHQQIANDIWEKVKNSSDEAEKYLIGCAKINNPFCQNKLKDYVLLHDSFGISLIQACADHLFEKNSAFPLDGNAALVFKALRDFRHKDTETKKTLLPIAQQILDSFQKAKNIRPMDFHWELCHSIREMFKESESQISSFDAPHIIDILFDVYFYTKNFKKMNSLLNDCFAVNGLQIFYKEAINFLDMSSDKKWKAVADCTFKDDSPVTPYELTY